MKKDTTKAMNKYLADITVMYVKLHNLHWNVVGVQFKSAHEYLEEIYDSFAAVLDEVAEIIKMHKEVPMASLKEYLEVATIKELDSIEITVADALKITVEDLEALRSEAAALRKIADEEDLFDVVAMLEDQISDYNKTIWFIDSMQK